MTTRRGLGKGKGSGWKNIISNDPHRHNLSRMGVKSAMFPKKGRKQPFAVKYTYRGKTHSRFTNPDYWTKGYNSACPTLHKLSKKQKEEIMSQVAASGLRGMKALELAEKLSQDKMKQMENMLPALDDVDKIGRKIDAYEKATKGFKMDDVELRELVRQVRGQGITGKLVKLKNGLRVNKGSTNFDIFYDAGRDTYVVFRIDNIKKDGILTGDFKTQRFDDVYWEDLPNIITRKRDTDGDGVPDSKDCQPFNPNRQDDTSAFKKASKDAKAQFAEGRSFGQIRESLITNPELDEGDIDMILSKVDTKAEKSPGTFDVGEITQPNKGVNDVGKIGASSKVEAFAKRAAEAGKKGFVFAKKEVAKYQKKQQEKKVKLLEKVKNPLAEKLIAQKKRVQELEKQISESQDSQQENKLFSELKEEENQLRELQEKVTDMKLQDFSDAELKTLAVRYQPDEGLLSGFFSTPSNPYEKELLRRIEKKEMLEKEITDTRKKAKSQESSGGGGFFGF